MATNKTIHDVSTEEEQWEISDLDDNWKKYQHKEIPLYFKLRHNVNNDHMLEFEVWDGERFLGADAHFYAKLEDFLKPMLYKKQFIVWCSNRKVELRS